MFDLAPEDNREDKVLLPGKQVPEGCGLGDRITVFVYRDSRDRLISTTTKPGLCLGEVAVLTVAQTGKLGAFLDWGLEKDLFCRLRNRRDASRKGKAFLRRCMWIRAAVCAQP